MSIHDSRGSGSSIRLEDGEVATVLLDVAKWGKRITTDDGRPRFLVAVFQKVELEQGGFDWSERTLPLSSGAFDALCLVCPKDGKVAVEVTRFGEGKDTWYAFKRLGSEADCAGLPVESNNRREPRGVQTMSGAQAKSDNTASAVASFASKLGL